MGLLDKPSRFEDEKRKAAEDEDIYEAAFGFKIKDEDEDEDEELHLDLFESNVEIYGLFKVIRLYMKENYELPENILLRLIDNRKLDVEKGLYYVAAIYHSYVMTIAGRADGN